MPKIAAAPAVPKFDVDALVALQRGNLDTIIAAQKIMFDLAQTVARKQVELVQEMVGKADVLMKGFDSRKQPQAYADEMKAAVEKAMADVKETVDLGIRAQSEVVDLFMKRATRNIEEMRAIAA